MTPPGPPQTPALVVDRSTLSANLDAMQTLCTAAGVRLRPHGKMHKCSTIGRMQLARGAVGLCAQTVGEAEAFVRGGIVDVLVTSPFPEWGAPRLVALAAGGHVGATVDHIRQIQWLSNAARDAAATIDVVIDVDPGNQRTGVDPADAVALARAVSQAPGLRYAGMQMYAGHLQHVPRGDDRRAAYSGVISRAASVVEALTAAGLRPEVVTGGGTGTHAFDLASGVFTELQAGSYAFMDSEYGSCDPPAGGAWPFQQALWLATTVISANHATHVTVDAGIKRLAMDGPPAQVAGGAPDGSIWKPMGDEHGFIVVPEGTSPPALGSIVWLKPGHVDPTVNLYDAVFAMSEGGWAERWAIDARRVTPDPALTRESASPG